VTAEKCANLLSDRSIDQDGDGHLVWSVRDTEIVREHGVLVIFW